MNLRYHVSTVALTVALFTRAAGAATVTSTFDADLDGWLSNPQGTALFVSPGGNPGGYLQETDAGSQGNMHAAAPSKFLGDLTGFGNLSVDILLYAQPTDAPTAFGQLTFTNSLGSFLILDLGNPGAAGAWTHYATSLDAATFGVSAIDYSAVMSNVTSLTLILESDKNVNNETVGMDNFALFGESGAGGAAAVPEPATFALLGLGLTSLALVHRKRTR
ncbi:MAG TPA: PEP-CTERM sorting domain-containing protein [Bryobacteraceae bacterium]|nr:PEP-CTERM sorting domain-containing protein [Bryobacteraceae bacterium]